MEVADAAGLKHVGIIHGDEDFYESMNRGGGKFDGTNYID